MVPRRRLGVALRQLREQARKSLDDAAGILECSSSKVSRLETGKGIPRSRDVRELIGFYGEAAEARRDELLELATAGQRQAWWAEFNDVIQGDLMAFHLRRYVELEADAGVITAFEPELVHGLLQTADYAHAICSAFFPLSSPDERARFVEFRMRRQEALRAAANPLRLHLLTGEGALRLPIGGTDVMVEQLLHLLELIDDERLALDFRVVPFSAGAPWVLGGPISILSFDDDQDQDLVYLEYRGGAAYLEDQSELEHYQRVHGYIGDAALDRDRSLEAIRDAVEVVRVR